MTWWRCCLKSQLSRQGGRRSLLKCGVAVAPVAKWQLYGHHLCYIFYVTQLSLLKIFVIYYMLHDHAPKRMIITQGVFLLAPKSHFCVLELKQLWSKKAPMPHALCLTPYGWYGLLIKMLALVVMEWIPITLLWLSAHLQLLIKICLFKGLF